MDQRSVRLRGDGDDVVRQIIAASAARSTLDCGSAGSRGTLDAEALRRACLASDDLDPFGIRIADATIVGSLDLRAVCLGTPLWFERCTFTDPPLLDGADLHELGFVGDGHTGGRSFLPGLLANGVRIRRDLVLSGTTIKGAHWTSSSMTRTSAIWLTEADIGGRLLAVGTHIQATGDRAIQADRTRVGGDVRLVGGFKADGEVRLLAVQFNGSLDLTAATLLPRDGRALDVSESFIGGSFFLLDDPDERVRAYVRGRIEMGRAVIRGRVLIRNAVLRAPAAGTGVHDYNRSESGDPVALLAERLTVHGDVGLESVSVVDGGIVMPAADLRGGLTLTGCTIRNPGGRAIDLSYASLGAALSLRDAVVEGTAVLTHMSVAGQADFDDAHFVHPSGGRCISAVGARVDGDLGLRRLSAHGGSLDFRGSVLGGTVDAEGATLANQGDKTLSLVRARVAGNVRLCTGFSSAGLLMLNRAAIDGRLRFDGATLSWQAKPAPDGRRREPNLRGSAVEAISAVVRGGINLGWRVESGGVDFTDAHTSFLADDPSTDWPVRSHLSGFVYEEFAPTDMERGRGEWDAGARARWLGKLEPYDPRPWEQAASVLRASGDSSGAEHILIAQRRFARTRPGTRRGLPWVGDLLMDKTVRYGFRPQRALFLVLILITLVAASLSLPAVRQGMSASMPGGGTPISAGGNNPCGGGSVRCFDPALYAIDTVVPIIDLKQRTTWYPGPKAPDWLDWWLGFGTIFGWLAFTVFALSFTRLGQR